MSAQKKLVCIASKTNPQTGLAFGDKYGEPVPVRRPTSADKITMSTRHLGMISAYGAHPSHVAPELSSLAYIFCLLDVLCDPAARPDWTRKENVFEEDEAALFAFFEEVSLWLATFRPAGPQPPGGTPG
jgi:hypothetical protein